MISTSWVGLDFRDTMIVLDRRFLNPINNSDLIKYISTCNPTQFIHTPNFSLEIWCDVKTLYVYWTHNKLVSFIIYKQYIISMLWILVSSTAKISFFFFDNLGCPGQLTHTSTNPTGSVHRTLGSFPTRIRVSHWLFTRGCGPKELFAPKRCWTLDLKGSKPSRPRPSPLGPTPWGWLLKSLDITC